MERISQRGEVKGRWIEKIIIECLISRGAEEGKQQLMIT